MENEKISQIGFSDEFSYCNTPIKYEVTEDKKLQLYVSDCSFAIGVVKKNELKDGSISITIRWDRVYEDLVSIDKIPNVGSYALFDNRKKKLMRDKLKKMTISQEEVINWCKKASTDISNGFMQILTQLDTNNIKDTIIVTNIPSRKEIEFLNLLEPILKGINIEGIRQYPILAYKIDYYISELNIAIEYDEKDHKYYTYKQQEERQFLIEKELGCKFIRVSDEYEYGIALGIVIKHINYQLYKPIIDMREVFKNDILPNDKILEPYDIEISREKIQICKSYIDLDTEEGEVDQEDIYSISEIDFLKSMFNNINVMRS